MKHHDHLIIPDLRKSRLKEINSDNDSTTTTGRSLRNLQVLFLVDGGVNVVEKRRFENPVTVKQLCNFIWRNGIYQHGGKPLGGRQGMGFVSDQSRPVPFHHSRLPYPGGGHP